MKASTILVDSISMQPLAGPALIKPGVVAYWMICGRYAALTEEIRVARTRFRRHQLDWLRMLLSGKKLAEDSYERILAAASSVRSPMHAATSAWAMRRWGSRRLTMVTGTGCEDWIGSKEV